MAWQTAKKSIGTDRSVETSLEGVVVCGVKVDIRVLIYWQASDSVEAGRRYKFEKSAFF